jgi:hypothetical protein
MLVPILPKPIMPISMGSPFFLKFPNDLARGPLETPAAAASSVTSSQIDCHV